MIMTNNGFVLDTPAQIERFRITAAYYVAVMSLKRIRFRHTPAAWRILAAALGFPVPLSKKQRELLLRAVAGTYNLTPHTDLMNRGKKEAKTP